MVDAMSERAAARNFGISRKTVNKMVNHTAPPGYQRKDRPVAPKLGAFVGIIGQILQDDREVLKKQRHTAQRIFERLRDEHQYTGGYTVVREFVAKERLRQQEVRFSGARSHHIGYGARRIAVLSLGKAVEQFTGHCKLLAATPRYAEAIDLITQAERVLVASYEELLRKAQLMGQTVFKDALKADPVFWQACMDEWGQGPGYKTRVAAHNRDWFDNESRRKIDVELKALIGREWAKTLQSVTELLEPVA